MVQKSLFDKLTKKLSKLNRVSVNLNTKFYGTKTNLIRIEKYSLEAFAGRNYDVMGHSEKRLKFDVIGNCTVDYQTNKMELFSVLDDDYKIRSTSFDINEILPIKMTIEFGDDYIGKPVSLMEGDMLIDLKIDENNNRIPILLEVMKTEGEFRGKFLIKRTADLSIVRNPLDTELKQTIRNYLENFEI